MPFKLTSKALKDGLTAVANVRSADVIHRITEKGERDGIGEVSEEVPGDHPDLDFYRVHGYVMAEERMSVETAVMGPRPPVLKPAKVEADE